MTPNESMSADGAVSHRWQRRSPHPEDDRVMGHACSWLNGLPKGVRPLHLPVEFPRIVNDLFRLWVHGSALTSYFAEKEFSPREGRAGFSPIIREELLAMHVYAQRNRLAPAPRVPTEASADAT